jgi:hypothetical protein
MNIPGFTAEASLGRSTSVYRREAAFDRSASAAAETAVTLQAFKAMTHAGSRSLADTLTSIGGGGTVGGVGVSNFACGRNSCRCHGVDDCIDLMVNTTLCGTYITCTFNGEPSCYCVRGY